MDDLFDDLPRGRCAGRIGKHIDSHSKLPIIVPATVSRQDNADATKTSILVIDPRCELTRLTARCRADASSQKGAIFDPFSFADDSTSGFLLGFNQIEIGEKSDSSFD